MNEYTIQINVMTIISILIGLLFLVPCLIFAIKYFNQKNTEIGEYILKILDLGVIQHLHSTKYMNINCCPFDVNSKAKEGSNEDISELYIRNLPIKNGNLKDSTFMLFDHVEGMDYDLKKYLSKYDMKKIHKKIKSSHKEYMQAYTEMIAKDVKHNEGIVKSILRSFIKG